MADPGGPALNVRGLRVAGPRGRQLVAVPDLSVPAGGSLGIRGPSGAGKSTLLFAIAGLLEAAEGVVGWGGHDLLALPAAARAAFRARHMGIVFQDFLLLEELDALANAALPAQYAPRTRRRAIRDRAAALLDRLGVHAPGQAAASLSGGERQRVAVARALANDAGILLADEPTANLDSATGKWIIELMKDLKKYRGIPGFLHRNRQVFDLYPKLFSGAMQTWFRVDGVDKRTKQNARTCCP